MQPQYATRICEHCQRSFDVLARAVRRGEGKYCSRQCSGKARTFSLEHAFNLRVDRSAGDDGCWPWMGRRDEDGYGFCYAGNNRLRAHRVAWALSNGRDPHEPPMVRHLCPGGGKPWCCNPRHLAEGTVQDNADDRLRDGNQARGQDSARAKLTDDQVREIRRRRECGERQRSLARAFGVNERTISHIVARRTWWHLP